MFYIIDSVEKREKAAQHVLSLPKAPQMCVEIKPYKKNRSTAQNKLYWMWLNVLSDYVGYTPDEFHEILKVRFLGIEVKAIEGHLLTMPKTTTSLGVDEFSEYLNKIEALAGTLKVVLPIPDLYGYAMGE